MNKRLIINGSLGLDTHAHLIVDQGKNNEGVGPWVARDKHFYLSEYIDAARAAARKYSQWVYIDPFCGPGRMRQRDEDITRPGGAVVAWLQSKKSGTPFGTMMIGDIDPLRSDACEARLLALGAPVKKYTGPADKTVLQMVKEVPQGSLCLVYIDPYNLALLSYSMIKALSALKKVDFVVHFSTMDLFRNVDAELDAERARFDDVSPGWRPRIGHVSKSTLPQQFFNDWMRQVRELDFKFSKEMPLVTNDHRHNIYQLVFFARHDLPIRLWGDIARNPTKDLFD